MFIDRYRNIILNHNPTPCSLNNTMCFTLLLIGPDLRTCGLDLKLI